MNRNSLFLCLVIIILSSSSAFCVGRSEGVSLAQVIAIVDQRISDFSGVFTGNITIASGSIYLSSSIGNNGIINKDNIPFIHDFHHPTGATAIPFGENTFIGKYAGNFTMGSTANNTLQASVNIGVGPYTLKYNTLGSYNTAVGYSNLNANTIGNYNSAFGFNAMLYNTTGSYNSTNGAYSLLNNTIGHYNSVFGYAALRDNITGNANTCHGMYSLLNNNNGGYNTAIGISAGALNSLDSANTGATLSVFIGANSKSKGTNGYNEVVIGSNAIGNGSNTVTIGDNQITKTYLKGQTFASGTELAKIDGSNIASTAFALALDQEKLGVSSTTIATMIASASQVSIANTKLGENAMASHTTSDHNVAIGADALSLNLTGSGNTAIGYKALNANLNGENTAIGYEAGSLNTTGIYNIFLGYYAGRNNSTGGSNTNSAFSTFLGYNSKPLGLGGVNEIVIGYLTNGNGSNTVTLGNDSIRSTYLRGTVYASGTEIAKIDGSNVASTSFTNALDQNLLGVAAVASETINRIASDALKADLNGSYTQDFNMQNANIATGSSIQTGGVDMAYSDVTNSNHFLFNSGNKTLTGTTNMGIGRGVLRGVTDGSDNIGIGDYVLKVNTSGYSNTFIGNGSGYTNADGSTNNAHGVNSLNKNTSGSANQAMGVQSLYYNTTGSYNTAIGEQAGALIQAGSANVNSNNSIFIGYATRAKQANCNNEIVIGDSAIGNGSNTVTIGNSSIIKTYLKGQTFASGTELAKIDGSNIASTAFTMLLDQTYFGSSSTVTVAELNAALATEALYRSDGDATVTANIPNNGSFTLSGLSEKSFSNLTDKPTTLAGYGITDAASITTIAELEPRINYLGDSLTLSTATTTAYIPIATGSTFIAIPTDKIGVIYGTVLIKHLASDSARIVKFECDFENFDDTFAFIGSQRYTQTEVNETASLLQASPTAVLNGFRILGKGDNGTEFRVIDLCIKYL